MKVLCDSNFFLALAIDSHSHHPAAVRWLEAQREEPLLYFCRATQTSFLRILTVSEWLKENVFKNDQAISAYEELRSDSRIGFLETEPPGLERQWLAYAGTSKPAPKRWMDAYLAAFARCSALPFLTFDRGFREFHDVELILLNP